jgi:hypothetical protein
MKTLTRPAALLAVLLAACGDSGGGTPAQAAPGVLTVNLAAPVAGDRALVISLSGPGEVSDVQPAAGYVAYTGTQGAATRVAVMGAIAAGPLLRFAVPDMRRAGEYHAAVVDAADLQNTARTNLAAYSLTLRH